jgi:L-aminopeptidase/D-esterase-like protein
MTRVDPSVLKLPVVAETFDRMTHPHVPDAIVYEDLARALADMGSGPLREGNVGWV